MRYLWGIIFLLLAKPIVAQNAALAIGTSGLLITDYLQTNSIIHQPWRYYERNWVLGKNPSEAAVSIYYGAIFLGGSLLLHHIRPSTRNKILFAVAAVECFTIIHNVNDGVGMRLPF